MTTTTAEGFVFKQGDLVLVKWNDSMVYFAKIKRIDGRRRKCVVVFDDKSQDEADFGQIHSVDETTTDIICIKCKRDDSDTPNEIVLCDRCGIGYHQKCHSPPIPASALELDTPWNCAYCLRGTKCPYLTESLDVLQNLMSDEEGQSHDEVDSVTTAESDEGGEEFSTVMVPQHGKFLAPPKPQKKRGRKPKVRRGPKPRDQTKSPLTISTAEITNFKKEDSVESVESSGGSSPAPSLSSSSSSSSSHREMHLRRKRQSMASSSPTNTVKRLRKSSVQSQTLSVTRIMVPVHSNSGIQEELGEEKSKRRKSITSPLASPPTLRTSESPQQSLGSSHPSPSSERKPKRLRVSLNLPDEVEPGSPIEKVIKIQRIPSPKVAASSLPLWEDDMELQALSTSTSSSGKPLMKSPPSSGVKIINLVSQRTSPAKSDSQSPKSDSAPLTPFTASALPLRLPRRTSDGETESKRIKEEDERDREEDRQVIKPKPVLRSPPDSPLDDVFSSPSKSDSFNTVASPSSNQQPVLNQVTTPQQQQQEEEQEQKEQQQEQQHQQQKQQQQPPAPIPPTPPTPCPNHTEEQEQTTVTQNTVILPPPPPSSIAPVGYGIPNSQPEHIQPPPSQHDTTDTRPSERADSSRGVLTVSAAQVTIDPVNDTANESPPIRPKTNLGPCNMRLASKELEPTTNSAVSKDNIERPVKIIESKEIEPSVKRDSVSDEPIVKKDEPDVKKATPKDLELKEGKQGGAGVIKSPSIQGKSSPVLSTTLKNPPTPVVAENKNKTSSPKQQGPLPQNQPSTGIVVSDTLPQPQPQPQPGSANSSGANAVSVIIARAPVTSTLSTGTLPKARPTPTSKDSDIIITSVERPPVSSPSSSSGTPVSGPPTMGTKNYSAASTKQHPPTSRIRHPETPPSSGKQRFKAIPTADNTTGSGTISQSVVMHKSTGVSRHSHNRAPSTTSSQSPVSVVPVVATPPPGYPHPLSLAPVSSSTLTLIPTEATAVVSSVGQNVAITVPPPPPPGTTRAVKPGSLPIKDPAPAVQYIQIEPLGSKSLIYSQTAGIPVAVTPQASSSNLTGIVAGKPLPVTTTKPYAIVSAQPTATIQSVPLNNQQGTPLISPPVQLGYTPASYIHTVPSTQTKAAALQTNTKSSKATSGTVRTSLQGTSTHQRLPEEQIAVMDEIGRNISDAFANSSEKMLIAAFEDAWKKFQANGKNYPSMGNSGTRKASIAQSETHTKPIPPPNAEVVSVPGASSRLSLIRPSYSRPKIPSVPSTTDQIVCVSPDTAQTGGITVAATPLADQPHKVQLLYCATTPGSVQPQQIYTEYPGTALYAVATNTPPQPATYEDVAKQSHRQGSSLVPRTSQVQSTGIFIPAHVTDLNSVVGSKQPQPQSPTVVIDPLSKTGHAKNIGQIPRSQPQVFPPKSHHDQTAMAVQHMSVLKKNQSPAVVVDHHQMMVVGTHRNNVPPPGKVTRQCAMCSKEATYLCSGCQKIWYCGKECQLKAWDEHSENCRR